MVEAGAKESAPAKDEGQGGLAASQQLTHVLAKTVSGLQETMATAFQKMSGSLHQSLNMMNSMNECMEEYVRGNIKLNVDVCPANGSYTHEGDRLSPTLKITVLNTGRFPVRDLTLSLSLQTVDGSVVLCEICGQREAPPSKRTRCSPMTEKVLEEPLPLIGRMRAEAEVA